MSRDLIETGLGWSWGPDRVARSIANKDTFTLLACDHDRVVAFAIMYFGDEHAHLNLLAVRPSHQRLYWGIMAPGAVLTILFGMLLLNYVTMGAWLYAKL